MQLQTMLLRPLYVFLAAFVHSPSSRLTPALICFYQLCTVYCLMVVHKIKLIHWLNKEKGRKKITFVELKSCKFSKLDTFSCPNLVSTCGQTSDGCNCEWTSVSNKIFKTLSGCSYSLFKAFKKQQGVHWGSSLPVQRQNQHRGDGSGKCGWWHGWVVL